MRARRLIVIAVAAGLAGATVGAGISAAADPSTRSGPAEATSPAPVGMGSQMGGMGAAHNQMMTSGAMTPGAMDAMHAGMMAGLSDDERAAMDAMHAQMHPGTHGGAGHDAHHPAAN